jgi:hypothetical protein
MKKLILFLAIVLVTTITTQAGTATAQPAAATTQSINVPPSVLTAFTNRFPNARVRDWQQRPEGYIADFKLDGKKLFAYYTADGTWKATETPIKWTRLLPSAVKEGWKNSNYAAWYVEDIKKIDQPNGPLYALHINNGTTLDSDHAQVYHEEYVIFFNESGQLIRKDRK